MVKLIVGVIYLLVLLIFTIAAIDCLSNPLRILEHATARFVLTMVIVMVGLLFVVWEDIK